MFLERPRWKMSISMRFALLTAWHHKSQLATSVHEELEQHHFHRVGTLLPPQRARNSEENITRHPRRWSHLVTLEPPSTNHQNVHRMSRECAENLPGFPKPCGTWRKDSGPGLSSPRRSSRLIPSLAVCPSLGPRNLRFEKKTKNGRVPWLANFNFIS